MFTSPVGVYYTETVQFKLLTLDSYPYQMAIYLIGKTCITVFRNSVFLQSSMNYNCVVHVWKLLM